MTIRNNATGVEYNVTAEGWKAIKDKGWESKYSVTSTAKKPGEGKIVPPEATEVNQK